MREALPFGARLGRLLDRRVTSASSLAVAAGCPRPDVDAVLAGDDPSTALRRLAPALNLHTADLWGAGKNYGLPILAGRLDVVVAASCLTPRTPPICQRGANGGPAACEDAPVVVAVRGPGRCRWGWPASCVSGVVR